MDCAYLGDAVRATGQRVEYDRGIAATNADRAGDLATDDPKLPAVDLRYDLRTLEHARAELAKCLAWNERAAARPRPTKDCASSEFFDCR